MSNVIRQEVVPAAEGGWVWISTVNLAGPFERGLMLDESMFAGHHGGHIETMVFRANEAGPLDSSDLDCARTPHRALAEAQHAAMVAKWKVSQ